MEKYLKDCETIELFNELDQKMIDVCKNPSLLSEISKNGLKILMNICIKYEEYELCSLIKKEIKNRKKVEK